MEERVPHKPPSTAPSPSADLGRAARRTSRPSLARFRRCCRAVISCPAQLLAASRAGTRHGRYILHLSQSELGERGAVGLRDKCVPPNGMYFCCSWPGEHSYA